jgi:quinohemoprotein ethanol dehydrogenase
MQKYILLTFALFLALSGCGSVNGDDWPAGGRDYSDQHYSPLADIDPRSVGKLKLAWYADIPAPELAVSTPIEVEGVLYTSTGYSITRAFDAATGRKLWEYNPDVRGDRMRASWGTRGLSYWNGHVIIATTDGRLISLDASTGKPGWSVQTLYQGDSRYITGAPRVYGDRIVIGNGGSDNGNRGFVAAYDAPTGKFLWRFYTVPGDPAKGFENDAMAMAAKTWRGRWWENGGGGSVWHAITYDPDFDTLYIGTGNGAPWNRKVRSPGGGDNLFLCSIVALDAKTGAYKWHYQINPGETWDYNAAMDIQLATLKIDGKPRKVLMQAPKNGFFYVIDRETGKLISAEKFSKVTWADRIDLKSGRPVENANARFPNGAVLMWPGTNGAHNWQAMSFNPGTGLVYIPELEMPGYFSDKTVNPRDWKPPAGKWLLNSGLDPLTGEDVPPAIASSSLVAWDPVSQKQRWRIKQKGFWNGGTLTTAGGLVFQGRSNGQFSAFSADRGKMLWTFDAQAGIIGSPISYRVKGTQYVTVISGFGGTGAMFGSLSSNQGWRAHSQMRRILTFSLDGTATLPKRIAEQHLAIVDDPGFSGDPAAEAAGKRLYHATCFMCHGIAGIAGGQAPDLRTSGAILSSTTFRGVVAGGALEASGMPKFNEFTGSDIEDVRAYLRRRATDARQSTKQATKGKEK